MVFFQRIRIGEEWWQRVIFKVDSLTKGNVQWTKPSKLAEVKEQTNKQTNLSI